MKWYDVGAPAPSRFRFPPIVKAPDTDRFSGFYAGIHKDEPVILIFDPLPEFYFSEQVDRQRKRWWQWHHHPAREMRDLTRGEYETLHEMCEIPKIHIRDFTEWERTFHAESNARSAAASSQDPGRAAGNGVQSRSGWRWLLGLHLHLRRWATGS